MRQTSIDAYNTIKENGLLSKTRFQVYEALVQMEEATANQLAVKLKARVKGSVCARLTELRDRGVISEAGEVTCPVSGINNILWQATDALPVNPPKVTKIKCTTCNGKGHL